MQPVSSQGLPQDGALWALRSPVDQGRDVCRGHSPLPASPALPALVQPGFLGLCQLENPLPLPCSIPGFAPSTSQLRKRGKPDPETSWLKPGDGRRDLLH